MRNIRLLFIVCMCVLCGCGTTKRTTVKTSNERYPDSSQNGQNNGRILYPKGADRIVEGKDVSTASVSPSKDKKIEKPRPEIKFSAAQSAHVRTAGVNPMPDGGLILDLDELQNEFCYPYKGRFLSAYGMRGRAMHTGIDIKAVPNDTIRAAFAGVVRMSKLYSSYGNVIVIQHYHGFETLYSHNSRNLVKVNDVVEAGQPIALAGRTGRATTEHLHFEIRVACHHFDPKKMVDVDQMKLRPGKLFIEGRNNNIIAYNHPSEVKGIEESLKQNEIIAQNNANAAAAAKNTQPSNTQAVYYKVKKGDTLYGIALRNKTTVRKLCELNKIKETTVLQINQRLRIR